MRQSFLWNSGISSVLRPFWSSIGINMVALICNHFSTQLLEKTISSKQEFTSVFMILLEMGILHRVIYMNTSLSWFLLLFILKTWKKNSKKSTSLLQFESFSFSLIPKELEEFTLKICSLQQFLPNYTSFVRKDTQRKILHKTGSPFNIRQLSIQDFVNSIQIKMAISRKKIYPNIPKGFLQLSLIESLNNILLWMDKWTIRDSLSLCLLWIIKRLHKPFNISGVY